MVHEGFRTRLAGCCSKNLVWVEGLVLKRGVFATEPATAVGGVVAAAGVVEDDSRS